MEKQLSISTDTEEKCSVAPVPAALVRASLDMEQFAYSDHDTIDSLVARLNALLLVECGLYSVDEIENGSWIYIQISISAETTNKMLDRVAKIYKVYGKYDAVDWDLDEPVAEEGIGSGNADEADFMKVNFYFKL